MKKTKSVTLNSPIVTNFHELYGFYIAAKICRLHQKETARSTFFLFNRSLVSLKNNQQNPDTFTEEHRSC